MWDLWNNFLDDWVPKATRNEDYVLVLNGDIVEGVHHGTVTPISHNLKDQRNVAIEVLGGLLKRPHCKGFYAIRGTESHVGKSGQDEEEIAKDMHAIPDEYENHARWEMWMRVGEKNSLAHFSHHMGITSSAAYESTALTKELIEAYTESGKQGNDPPDVIIRSHRHRYFKTEVPTAKGYGIAVVTPGWQLKTPHTFRFSLGRTALPQFGGILIRGGDEDPIYTRAKVWFVGRDKEVNLNNFEDTDERDNEG